MTRITTSAERVEFGLFAWLEETRVILPLKGVECRFAVCGDLLEVEIDQVYHQDNSAPLECLYTFPLPGDAAVHRCEMHVNGRVIRAKVEEEQRARETYEEKKAAGHRAVLVEMERENLFTLSLGNVQPGDMVVIRLAYFQILTRLGNWACLQIPFCPGVRYIPGSPLLRAPSGRGTADDTDQVPDASSISPPRIDRFHPDAAYLSIRGSIRHGRREIVDVLSTSHPIMVRDEDNGSTVALADNAAVPDCNLALRWTEVKPSEAAPRGWLCQDNGTSYALVRLVAPEQAPTEDEEGQDVYFLVDRSGSMEGLKWEKAIQAFRAFLKELGPKDRVWATFFQTEFSDLAERPLSAAALARDAGVANLEKLGTAGGTELLPALEHVLTEASRHSQERRMSVVLITDGQVGNEARIIQVADRHPAVRIHAFGIDTSVNDAFLKDLAARHRGTCHLVTPQEDIPGVVARLGARLRRPVLTDLEVAAGWEGSGEIPQDLLSGEVVTISLRAVGQPAKVALSGRRPGGGAWQSEIALEECAMPALRLLWARRRISHHLALGQKAAAISLAKETNLICDGTAFVAWDEAEQVAVSQAERALYQPAMAVLGTAYCSRYSDGRAPAKASALAALTGQQFGRRSASFSLKRRARSVLEMVFGGSEQTAELAEAPPIEGKDALVARLEARLGKFVPGHRRQELIQALLEWLSGDPAAMDDRLQELNRLLEKLERVGNNRLAIVRTLLSWTRLAVTGSSAIDTKLLRLVEELHRMMAEGAK